MKPTKDQKAVIDLLKSTGKPVCWLGTVRAGKTVGGVMAIMTAALDRPGPYAVCAYTYPTIERNILPVVTQYLNDEGWADDDYKLKKSYPFRLEMANGSTVYFIGASDEAAYKAIQGMTLQAAFVDECLLIPQSFIMQLVARLSLPDPWLLLTANKEAPNHWLKRNWIDEGLVQVVESSFTENPHIGKGTREWYEGLIIGAYADRMLENEWSTHGNPIVEAVHIDRDFELRNRKGSACAYYVDEYQANFQCVAAEGSEDGETCYIVRVDELDAPPKPMIDRHNVSNRMAFGFGWVKASEKLVAASAHGAKVYCNNKEVVSDLAGLHWVSRDKPSIIPPNCMSVLMAIGFLRDTSTPFSEGQLL